MALKILGSLVLWENKNKNVPGEWSRGIEKRVSKVRRHEVLLLRWNNILFGHMYRIVPCAARKISYEISTLRCSKIITIAQTRFLKWLNKIIVCQKHILKCPRNVLQMFFDLLMPPKIMQMPF